MSPFRLDGKVAIITGGAHGIGAASVALFEQSGATVVSLDISTGCDVTDERAVAQAFARAEREHGGIDLLVNNAGRANRKPATELSREEWDAVVDLNLTAVFLCSRAAQPYMKKRGGGAIVNLASIMGFSGGIFPNASYQATKGAVVNLTRALAMDLGKKGVRVNSVCPSLTRTGMTTDMMDDKELLSKFAERIPLGRVCEPQEVAAVIAFLASDDASFMTGANVAVDGGVSASNGQPPQQ